MATSKSIDRRYVANCARVFKQLAKDFSSQTALANALGVSQTLVSDMLTDKETTGIGAQVLIQLRDYTGLSIEELLGLDPPKAKRLGSGAAERQDAFAAAAPLALFDGALPADVIAARRHPDASDPRLTGREAYDIVMRAKRRREESDPMASHRSPQPGGAAGLRETQMERGIALLDSELSALREEVAKRPSNPPKEHGKEEQAAPSPKR